MSRTCRIAVMGRFLVEVGGRAVPARAWHHDGDTLVKLLAMERTHRLEHTRVLARLWPSLDTRAAGKRLEKAVHGATRALGDLRGVTVEGEYVRLWPAGELQVDLQDFEVAARRAASARGAREALALYGGELLPEDRDAEWTQPLRTELRRTHQALLEASGEKRTPPRLLTELEALRPR